MTLKENIMLYIAQNPGATDAEIEKHLQKTHQAINQTCRALERDGYLIRRKNAEKSNRICNYPLNETYVPYRKECQYSDFKNALQEEDIKHILANFLISEGWNIKVAWGHQQGIDIDAQKNEKRWIIEVKGPGSRQPMRVNYFISILGETLQRMNDTTARYSIALPDIEQYRKLWDKLPKLAKERTTIDLILVDENGNIHFEK